MTENSLNTREYDAKERLSALADGELAGEELGTTLAWAGEEDAVRGDWDAYHVIGEVLRGSERSGMGCSPAFVERLRAKIAQEPVVVSTAPSVASVAPAQHIVRRAAANEPAFRWKMVAGVASIAAVAAISWNVMSGSGNSGAAQLASNAPAAAMIRDARLDELLAAHKQGGASALQMPSGFLRNATFEAPDR